MMQVDLGAEFSRDLAELAKLLQRWPDKATKELKRAHSRIGQRWKAGAIERVPVDEGTLKQRIVTDTTSNGKEVETVCGSNVPYAPFLEFGTRHIAGGRVKALGTSPHITDAQAVTVWPAKNAGIVGPDGTADSAVVSALNARLDRGGAQEQMPFLRPAFAAIREWALDQIIEAIASGGDS